MGHEYKLLLTLTAAQRTALSELLDNLPIHHRTYDYAGQEIREFRSAANTGKLPDFLVIAEADGLYICQNGRPDPWWGLADVAKYLRRVGISFDIVDYSA